MAKILLVEDNEMNRDMLSRRLAERGYEVVIAVDGEQGVAMAALEAPALILMDMSLPGLDGWEATRQLKADAGDPARSPSSRSPPTPWPATARRRWRRAATTSTPSRSSSPGCSRRSRRCSGAGALSGA